MIYKITVRNQLLAIWFSTPVGRVIDFEKNDCSTIHLWTFI